MNEHASSSNIVNFLSQNMWLTNYAKVQPPFKKERAMAFITEHAPKFDVICLQEVFKLGRNVSYSPLLNLYNSFINGIKSNTTLKDNNTMVDQFLMAAKINFPYIAESRPPTTFFQDSGLLILSKHKILKSEFVPFKNTSWSDYMCADKGVLYAQIEIEVGHVAHFITTHLDAHSSEVRYQQVQEIGTCVQRWVKDRASEIEREFDELIVICGDFNIDSRSYNSAYSEMMKIFNHYSFVDIFSYGNDGGMHPCTYQGLATLDHILVNDKGLSPKCSVKVVLKNFEKKRIDYKVENLGTLTPMKMDISDHNGLSLRLQT
jgi:endonuclease/exonuclease/phosphatase family metal-dependent hydrolase